MATTPQTLSSALNEVTEESLDDLDAKGSETTPDETTSDAAEGGEEVAEAEGEAEETAEGEADTEAEADGAEEDEEYDVFDTITPAQLASIKANPELNSLRKSLMKGYESKATELKQLVQLGEAWKQNPARVVNALADSLGLTVQQAKAVAAQAGAVATAVAEPAADSVDQSGKELEALFGDKLGPRVRSVFEKWADARLGRALGAEVGPIKNVLGQVVSSNEQSRMQSEEATFKSRHKDLTPGVERMIVELGNSGKYVPGKNQTPQGYLEALHDIATATLSRQTAKKATGAAAKQLARKIDANRKDREPSGVSGRGGSVKSVSKVSEARSISEALDIAERELREEGSL
jgi:hypothetical protein